LYSWDFSGQNLTNTSFYDVSYDRSNFEGADLRGAQQIDFASFEYHNNTKNTIYPDGSTEGLDLSANHVFVIRDYDGNTDAVPTPIDPISISIHEQFQMTDSSVLELHFESDEWNSIISFEAGIPVALDGTLQLTFAEDVNISNQIGRTIDLFDWTGVAPTGLFDVSSLYEWDLTHLYTSGEVTLVSVAELPGDFDGDGDVDGRDLLALQRDPNLGSLTAWQANYGGSLSAIAVLPGDFDGDNDVDGRDLLEWQRNPSVGNLGDWKANFGTGTLTATSMAVPEPNCLILLFGFVFLRRR
jgi:hypothetical protein